MFNMWYLVIILSIITGILWIVERFFILQLRGYLGERKVVKVLKSLPEDEYRLLSNVMLSSQHGLTQIDHILVSMYGIFVIETKNMKGKIYGDVLGEKWTKYSDGRKVVFKNPIHQNYGHVKAVQDILKIDESRIINLVVMAGSAVLEFAPGKNVVYLDELRPYISSFSSQVFPNAQLDELVMMLTDSNRKTLQDKRIHMQEVNQKITERKTKEAEMICPRCNGKLIPRNGRYGMFYGCINYPKCRYTQNYSTTK